MLPLAMGKRLASLAAVMMLLLCSGLVLVACGDDDDGGDGEQNSGADFSTIRAGKLTVGSDIPYAPFEFGRAPNYEGFDIDLVTEIAERLKLEAEFVKTPFDTYFPQPRAGKIRPGGVGLNHHGGTQAHG